MFRTMKRIETAFWVQKGRHLKAYLCHCRRALDLTFHIRMLALLAFTFLCNTRMATMRTTGGASSVTGIESTKQASNRSARIHREETLPCQQKHKSYVNAVAVRLSYSLLSLLAWIPRFAQRDHLLHVFMEIAVYTRSDRRDKWRTAV